MSTSAASPGKETISVALCTYNGARFLSAQLESMLTQTRLPDELVVCDDRSTDNTVEILQSFAARAPFPVRIVINEQNLGSNRNFEKAIGLCAGTLIALSDQDDIWLPHRLAASSAALEREDCGLLFGDGLIINDENQPTGATLWNNFLFTPQLRNQLRCGIYTPMARYFFITGATVMFRARYRPYLFPVRGEWVHDGWIAMMIAALAGVCFLEQPLIQYRFHAQQQLGLGGGKVKRDMSLDAITRRHWSVIDSYRSGLIHVVAAIDQLPETGAAAARRDFRRHYAFLQQRLTLPRNRILRLLRILRLTREYRRGASGWLSITKDLLLPKANDETGAAERNGYSIFSPAPALTPASPQARRSNL